MTSPGITARQLSDELRNNKHNHHSRKQSNYNDTDIIDSQINNNKICTK